MVTVDDFAQFLTDRYDEAEARARVWQQPLSKEDFTHWRHVGQRRIRYDNGRDELFSAVDVRGTVVDWAEAIWVKWDINGERAAYIAANDPARRLADIKLKRAILALHQPDSTPPAWCTECSCQGAFAMGDCLGTVDWPCATVRQLGTEFDKHPAYKESWKPS